MDLDELDRLIQDRESRIEKRKEEGTLFEKEGKKNETEDEDARLADEVQKQKDAMAERMQAQIPPCPQCGVKMTYVPEQSMIVCQTCGVGMRV